MKIVELPGVRDVRLRVAYVTMCFPWPSETFAVTEVLKLTEAGVDVQVFSLLPVSRRQPVPRYAAGRLAGRLRQWSWRGYVNGVFRLAGAPRTTLALLSWIIATSWRKPGHVARSLILVPRAMTILRQLQAHPPDVVHLFWGHYPSLVAFLVRRQLPEVIVSTFLGAYDLSMGHEGGHDIARSADCVITHAEVNRPALEQLGVCPDRTHVVARGIDIGYVDSVSRDIEKRRHRLVWVGRMIPDKGVLSALEVLRRLRESGGEFTMDIVGDGPDRRSAEAVAAGFPAGTVRFHGLLAYDETLRVIAAADLLLLLSTKPGERLPNVVKEALAVDTLAVMWRVPGAEELMMDGTGGRVVESGDISGAAQAILELLSDEQRADACRRRGRGRIEALFDARKSTSLLISIWLRARAHAREVGGRADLAARG